MFSMLMVGSAHCGNRSTVAIKWHPQQRIIDWPARSIEHLQEAPTHTNTHTHMHKTQNMHVKVDMYVCGWGHGDTEG